MYIQDWKCRTYCCITNQLFLIKVIIHTFVGHLTKRVMKTFAITLSPLYVIIVELLLYSEYWRYKSRVTEQRSKSRMHVSTWVNYCCNSVTSDLYFIFGMQKLFYCLLCTKKKAKHPLIYWFITCYHEFQFKCKYWF